MTVRALRDGRPFYYLPDMEYGERDAIFYSSLISPLSNLVAAPLIGFVVGPLALISSFAYLLTGYYIFGSLVGLTTDLSLWLVRNDGEDSIC